MLPSLRLEKRPHFNYACLQLYIPPHYGGQQHGLLICSAAVQYIQATAWLTASGWCFTNFNLHQLLCSVHLTAQAALHSAVAPQKELRFTSAVQHSAVARRCSWVQGGLSLPRCLAAAALELWAAPRLQQHCLLSAAAPRLQQQKQRCCSSIRTATALHGRAVGDRRGGRGDVHP